MAKCPVCEKISEQHLCLSCGFDASSDVEHFPTLSSIPSPTVAISRLRALHTGDTMSHARCPVCNCDTFRLTLCSRQLLCSRCGAPLEEWKLEYQEKKYLDYLMPKEPIPGQISPLAVGSSFSALLKKDGTVVFAKNGSYRDEIRIAFGEQQDYTMISSGGHHFAALRADGTVMTIGYSGYRQCNTAGWRNITAIAAGGYHTLGLRSNGRVLCVGENGYRQCNVEGWSEIVSVAAGTYHSIGIKRDGTVVTAGSRGSGERKTQNWRNIIAAAAGSYFTVGLCADGTVTAVGDNQHGQCNVAGWNQIISIAAGDHHTVGLKKNGTVVAVGVNAHGECDVEAWTNVVAIAAGNNMTLGLRSDGKVLSTGRFWLGMEDPGSA